MLDAKTNRLDYGEQIIPKDSSYELDFAVGTTYSLDLEAIMVLPVAMFYSRLLDCPPDALSFDVLDAITQAASKIRVYCQKGKIKAPRKYNRLMAYWEKGIAQISMDSAFSSFHPKVWVVRFTKEGHSAFYRLLITSRNLTYAHDWDVAFATEGEVGNKYIEKNQPLIQFLQYLSVKDGKPYPKGFLEDLAMVAFNLPEGHGLMNFHPIGIPHPGSGVVFANPLTKKSWDELLVISPFVDNTTLKSLAGKTAGKMSLLSRRDELDKIDADVIAGLGKNCVFQFSELIKYGESQEGICEGNPLEALPQDLHAKIFIGLVNGNSHWFMGSANCTQPAFLARNVEFMVELKSDQNRLTPKRIAKSLTECPKGEISLFEQYLIESRKVVEGDQSLESDLRTIIFDLTNLTYVGELSLRDAGEHALYDLTIHCDATSLTLPDAFSVRLKPIADATALGRGLQPGNINKIIDFKGYNELQLSPYLEINVFYEGDGVKSFVAEMQIDLPVTRMDKIFRSIIDDKEKVLKYLAFLLGGKTPEPAQVDGTTNGKQIHSGAVAASLLSTSLYEDFLVAASRRPERLRSVRKVIQRLRDDNIAKDPIVPEDLLKLWAVFDAFLDQGKK